MAILPELEMDDDLEYSRIVFDSTQIPTLQKPTEEEIELSVL